MKKTILIFSTIFFAFGCVAAQRTYEIRRPCPGTTTPASATIQRNGDVVVRPCPSRFVRFPSGTVDFTGSTVTGISGTVGGSGTVNFIPRFTAASTIGDTPLSWNGTNYLFNNTVLNSEFTIDFTPSTAAGRFRVGDFTTTPSNYIDLNQTAQRIDIHSPDIRIGVPSGGSLLNVHSSGIVLSTSTGQIDILRGNSQISLYGGGLSAIGDTSGSVNNTKVEINDNTRTINLNNALGFTVIGDANLTGSGTSLSIDDAALGRTIALTANTLSETGITKYTLNRTVIPTGTTGAQTIHRPNGTVNFAAGSSSLVVTNNTVTASPLSLVIATAQTNDATCSVKNVVVAAGSFTINMTANCTAETRVAFWVTN